MGGAVRRYRAVFVDAHAEELFHERAGFLHPARDFDDARVRRAERDPFEKADVELIATTLRDRDVE